jgi:beta-galactosidase GanA
MKTMTITRIIILLAFTCFNWQGFRAGSQEREISLVESIPIVEDYSRQAKLEQSGFYWTALKRAYRGDSVHYEAWFAKPDTRVGIFFGLGISTTGKVWRLDVPTSAEANPRVLPAPQLSLQSAVSLASEFIYANGLNKDTLYLESVNLILTSKQVKHPYWGLMLSKPLLRTKDGLTVITVDGSDIWIAVSMDSTVNQMGTL